MAIPSTTHTALLSAMFVAGALFYVARCSTLKYKKAAFAAYYPGYFVKAATRPLTRLASFPGLLNGRLSANEVPLRWVPITSSGPARSLADSRRVRRVCMSR